MASRNQKTKLANEDLALGVMLAIQTWRRPEYRLPFRRTRILGEEWFRDFLSRWSVARTIQAEKQGSVLELLNDHLVSQVWSSKPEEGVKAVAKMIRRRRMSALRRDGRRTTPVSLVSKLAFFFRPARLAPYDRFARKGLSHRVGSRNALDDYAAYIKLFNSEFRQVRGQIEHECGSRWVREFSRKLGISENYSQRVAFHRKVFDNVLMVEAGRFGTQGKDWS